MPRQPRLAAHPRDCDCDECLREYVEHFAAIRRFDELCDTDPEPLARDEFAAWLAQDPPVTCPEVY